MANWIGHVLIVDDDVLVALQQQNALEQLGYSCTLAEGLQQGWHCLRTQSFDAVIMDHDLGDGKGTELLARMTTYQIAPPVIYNSANMSELTDAVNAYSHVVATLAKPVRMRTVHRILGRLVLGRRSHFPRLINGEERQLLLAGVGACLS